MFDRTIDKAYGFVAGDTAFSGPLAVVRDGFDRFGRTQLMRFANKLYLDPEACYWEGKGVPSRFLSGKVALIAHGQCGFANGFGFVAKARYAQRAGAIAVIYYVDKDEWLPWQGWNRPTLYHPDHHSWVDEISIPFKIIHNLDGVALRQWLANGLNLIAFSIDSHTLGIRVAGTCGTIDIDGTPCLVHQVKHVNGLATCDTEKECHRLNIYRYGYDGGLQNRRITSKTNTTASGRSCIHYTGRNGYTEEGTCQWKLGNNGVGAGNNGVDAVPWCPTALTNPYAVIPPTTFNTPNYAYEVCDIAACSLMGTLHANVGSCDGVFVSMGNHPEGREWTWSECAIECLDQHPSTLAIDGPKYGSCFCATTCPHLTDCGQDDSMALFDFELPTMCGSGGTA